VVRAFAQGEAALLALRRAVHEARCGPGVLAGLLASAKEQVDAARESTFPFLDESDAARCAYATSSLWWADVCLLEPLVLHDSGADDDAAQSARADAAAAALRACDLALLRAGVDEYAALAGPIMDRAAEMHSGAASTAHVASARSAHDASARDGATATTDSERHRWEAECKQHVASRTARPVARVPASALTREEFRSRYMSPDSPPPEPVILQGVASDWPAMTSRPWSDFSYLKQLGGKRLVSRQCMWTETSSCLYISISISISISLSLYISLSIYLLY